MSVLRRLLLATAFVPDGTPNWWDIISEFAFQHSAQQCTTTDNIIRLFLENIEILDSKAFATDTFLMKELHTMKGPKGQPLGVVLISPNSVCKTCGGELLTRVDRPSTITVYSETMGTVPVTHFHKYCQRSRKGCQFTQFYGYYTKSNWHTLPFFISTSMTAIETVFYIYNYMHKYSGAVLSTSPKCDHHPDR